MAGKLSRNGDVAGYTQVTHLNHAGPVVSAQDSATYVDVATAGPATITTDQLKQLCYRRECGAAGRSDTTPTAAQIESAFGLRNQGDYASFRVFNNSAASRTLTIVAGSGITLSPATLTFEQGEQGRLTFTRTSADGDPVAFTVTKQPLGAFDVGGPLVVSGDVDAVNGVFSGNITAVNGTFSGDVQSDNMTVVGDFDSDTILTTGLATLASLTIGGNPTFTPTPTVDATAGNSTYTAAAVKGGFIVRDPGGAPRTDVLPDGVDLDTAFGTATAGFFGIRNADPAETVTITGGSGSSIQGTATVAATEIALFIAIKLTTATWVLLRLS